MKTKPRLARAALWIWLFVVAVIVFTGIKLVETKRVSATSTNVYSVSSSDFSVEPSTTQSAIRLRYLGVDGNVQSLLTGYAAFTFENNALETDDGDSLVLQTVKPVARNLLEFRFTEDSYSAAKPIKIIIPKGQTFAKSGSAFQLADDLILEKTDDDTWVVAAAAQTVLVSITVNDDTTEEEMRTDATYTLPSVGAVAGKTFVGWEINGDLYAVGETVAIADYIDEETQSVTLQAKYFDYTLESGAAIRCDKDMSSSGIRFKAILNAVGELPAYITGLGVIVMPQDLIGKDEFTLDNYDGAGQAKNFSAQRADISAGENDTFTFYAAIISVLEPNYNRTFAARAYLIAQTHDGETQYIWCDGIETRSVYEVATKAACDEDFPAEHMKIVQTYLNKVVNITYDGNTAKLVSVATAPVIKDITVEKTEETVVLILETSETDFPALTMNGIRIKDFSVQTHESGLKITFTLDEA